MSRPEKSAGKRKAADGNIDRPSIKKPRTDSASQDVPKPQIKSSHNEGAEKSVRPVTKSLLAKEQPAFPRGGASLLTPLEKKQIDARAWRDAQKEEADEPSLFDDHKRGAGDEKSVSKSEGTKNASDKSKKGSKSKGKQQPSDARLPKDTTIGGLSYKRLAVGSLILGQVASIGEHDLTVSLPNSLTAFVPITAISKRFSAKVQQVVEKDDQPDNGEAEDEDEIALQDHFSIGQFLRVVVTSLGQAGSTAGNQSRKRIELSIEPGLTNLGLSKPLLATGVTIQAAVSSVEDHGVVVDLDLEAGKCSGFIASKNLPEGQGLDQIKEGAVLLCRVIKSDADSKVVTLSASLSEQKAVKMPPTVEAFLPGTVADILITEVQDSGLVGQIMGSLSVTADVVHSGAFKKTEAFKDTYKVGAKIKGRLIYKLGPIEDCRCGFSMLSNVSEASVPLSSVKKVGKTVRSASIVSVEPGLGVYVNLGDNALGFAHISRLADGKVDGISATSGPYKVGSSHSVRITDFGIFDNLYALSMQQSVLDQRFLRLEDVRLGEKVGVKIDKVLIGPAGIKGLIVKVTDTITGFVPDIHLSDAVLANPEKKFREGASLKARVLSVDLSKRQMRLTAKKTLVNTDAKIWTSYADIEDGGSSLGTLVKVDLNGALVQFFGDVKGFLPVAEISEAYIKDARDHFRVGQVLTVHVLSKDVEEKRLTISCREPQSKQVSTVAAMSTLAVCSSVQGTVFEKASDDLMVRLEENGIIGRLSIDHVSDGSLKKRQSAFNKIRVGQKLEGLLVLDVQVRRNLVALCNRKSIIQAADKRTLLRSFDDLEIGKEVTGFVSNITTDGVFVSFASRISSLIPPSNMNEDQVEQPDFGMTKFQTITAKISTIDLKGATPRFWLTLKDPQQIEASKPTKSNGAMSKELIDPVDGKIVNEAQLVVGTVTKARIVSVKESQLNVELAKGVQGRVDVSEIYDKWEDMKDRKKPLQKFSVKQVIDVKVLGAHDSRSHRFLPISHRDGKTTVYELSAKPQAISNPALPTLTLQDLKPGDSHIAFVNNFDVQYVWVNISPSVRGRIKRVDVSNDLSTAADLNTHVPVGSAIRVRVVLVDAEKGRLDLTGKTDDIAKPLAINDVSVGQILAGRVTKVSDRQVMVSLSDSLAAALNLIDMADDYKDVNPAAFQKNEIVRACVVRVDVANKQVSLSTRPSKILSSSLPVADPELNDINKINVNDVYRGFVRNVDTKGVFVTLGHGLTGYVRVSHLSDDYIKEWKDSFQRDQLVRGKVIAVDKFSGHIQMSLKQSIISTDYKPPLRFTDLRAGDVVTGKVAKVEEFGVFIVVDNSEKIRGLCHRSEIAERQVNDARKLFKEGDAVKAKILKVDLPNNRVNFSLKASHFEDAEALDEDADSVSNSEASSDEDAAADVDDEQSDLGSAIIEEASVEDVEMEDAEDDVESESEDDFSAAQPNPPSTGIKVCGFDWHGVSATATGKRTQTADDSDEEAVSEQPKKRKKRADIEIDRTGDLDVNGPQSADDFERLLLGDADSSILWLQYMAFHLNLGDLDQARATAERALKSIGLGQDSEKQNIWIALLNLEVEHGDDDTLESAFQRACEFNDPKEMHNRLTSILIQAQKHDKADDLFQTMLKKYTQDPKIWVNYATFLFDTKGDADKARDVLPRALQTLPQFTHLDVTSKFAQLEFKSEAGVPERGRTIFEGLISSFPKRMDLYNVLLDLELKIGEEDQIRALFERITARKLKPKQAKYFFKRWLEFEEEKGDADRIETVKTKAASWIKQAGESTEG